MNKVQACNWLVLPIVCCLLLALLPSVAIADATLNAVHTLQTGTVPFDNDNLPGNDSSNNNLVVRTNDTLVISYQVGIDHEDETNIVFRVTGGPNIDFDLPPFCLTSGVTPPSSITGTVSSGESVTCNIGDKDAGSATAVSIPGRVMPTLMNGSSVSILANSVTGDTAGTQNFPGATVTVSASPKFDIFKNTGAGLKGSALGPNGEKGLVQLYPIGVKKQDKGFGAEHATSDIVILDDLSGISPNALLYQGWAGAPATACFGNGASTTYKINQLPYGYTQLADNGPGGSGEGPAANSVFNSGSFSCPSVSAGGTVTITISGADLSGSHYPSKGINGNALSVSDQYVVSGVLAVWFPVQDIIDNNNELTVRNEYIAQSFNSISGQTNVDPSFSNNIKSYVIRESSPGNGRYFLLGKNNGGGRLEGQTKARSGDGSLVIGQAFNTAQRQSNGQAYSETDYNNLNLCTSFDNTKQTLRKRSKRYADVTFTGSPRISQADFTIEYGTGAFGATATCDNADSPDGWTTDPTTLSGGIASVTKVRGVGNLIAPSDALTPTRAQLRVYYTALANPIGTIVPQWGTYRADNINGGTWVMSSYDEETALGKWGDRATITAVVVRISKDTVPSGKNNVAAGHSLAFELDWSATLFGTPPTPTTSVTITDTLPKAYSFIPNSSSLTPASVSHNADGTTRLIWRIPSATINANQPPITYNVLVKNTTADGTSVANTVVIYSPDDPTPEASRTDTYSMSVLNTSILSVFKEATPTKVGLNETYGYKLSYANTGTGVLSNLQMIDVLPNIGWSRNPSTNFIGTSTFVSVAGTNGEVFEYTKTPVGNLEQNPADASNQAGGSTVWCSNFSGGTCPASASEVTAFRATLPTALSPPDGVKEIQLTLQANNNDPGNTYTNNFTAVADELAISVTSVTAKTLVEITYDYSDAPASYGTAQHGILDKFLLGSSISAENSALPSPNADSDVGDDGATFPLMTQGDTITLPVKVSQTANNGYLQAWIDWNGDGDFEDTVDRIPEQISINAQDNTNSVPGRTDDSDTTPGQISLSFTVPPSATTRPTFARLRWSTSLNVAATGSVNDGEVEDYAININAHTGCLLGSGDTDLSVTPYISSEVRGTNATARNAVDALDNSWRTAAGLLNTGTTVPWFATSTVDPLGNNEANLFTTNGVNVGVALVNVEPIDTCIGAINTSGTPALVQSTHLQGSAPRPASLYTSSNQPAFWNEIPTDGNNASPNAVRFTFDTPVAHFGAWFGDLETRSDGNAAPAYLRLLDTSGNRIGKDIPIEPTEINDGGTISTVDQSQCGSSASNIGCGNSSTRWVGFIDNAGAARVKQVLVIVGDDDFGDDADLEHLSFIGADIVPPGHALKGVVFEDINYGGGAGRDQTTASGTGINGTTVELYNSSGAFVDHTTTVNDGSTDGTYTFSSVADGNYYVRIVSDTVNSTRTGSDGSELAVQTFRSDGTTATTNAIGGHKPSLVDAGAYDPSSPSTLNVNTLVFSGGTLDTQTAQSIQAITIAGDEINGVDFGFNFNTIVNTNDSGQGSLRQFILNSNLLGNTGLDQDDNPSDGATDPVAGVDTSIFEIPSNAIHIITPDTALPAITDAFTALDATTQQGASCQADARMLKVQLDGSNLVTTSSGLSVNAPNATIRGFSIGSFNGEGIDASATANDLQVTCSNIGVAADGKMATANNVNGVFIQGASGVMIGGSSANDANIIANNQGDAVTILGASATNNQIRRNVMYANGGLGIDLTQDDVTLNDANDSDTSLANNGLNFPQFNQTTLIAGNLTVTGCAPAKATIELFEADTSPTSSSGVSAGNNRFGQTHDYGEGEHYLAYWVMPTSGTACAMPVDADGNDPSGLLAFSQTFTLSSLAAGSDVALGDILTATATLAGTGTSEFSALSVVSNLDYGDAPASFGEAAHKILTKPTVFLGDVAADQDNTTQHAASGGTDGLGDDNDGNDDEDSYNRLPPVWTSENQYRLVVKCSESGSKVSGWIDFNQNNTFDAGEINDNAPVNCNGGNKAVLNWTGLASLSAGSSYARIRIASDASEVALPTGVASDGEVEDYSITLQAPSTAPQACKGVMSWFDLSGQAASAPLWSDVKWHAINRSADIRFTTTMTGTNAKWTAATAKAFTQSTFANHFSTPGFGINLNYPNDLSGAGSTQATITFDQPLPANTYMVVRDIDATNETLAFAASNLGVLPAPSLWETQSPTNAGANSPSIFAGWESNQQRLVTISDGPNNDQEAYVWEVGGLSTIQAIYATYAGSTNLGFVSCIPQDYGDAPNRYGTTQATTGPQHSIINQVYLGNTPQTQTMMGNPALMPKTMALMKMASATFQYSRHMSVLIT